MASGSKLKKVTTDNTVTPAKTTTTTYLNGFVYQNDTLQFIPHEEGRARWALHKYTNGTSAYGFEYDYFLKDHLGNVRMVLTQQKDTAKYIATMESAYRTTENQLFYNIPQSCYPRSAVAGYPTDNTTVPNDSLARVNGNGPKVGPSILLKVMSGDVVDIATKSFYKSGGTKSGNNSVLTDVLNSLAGGIVTATSATHGTITDFTTSGTPVYNAVSSFINTNNTDPAGKPKAYLNWILLDDQFKGVNTYPQSGAVPVGSADVLNTLAYSGIPITKNGYLYIWVSNETQGWDVFFDNLSVQHRTGAITEETHYYPFGLTMAGISSKAALGLENKIKFQGQELQHNEFSDGTGLEMYQFKYRMDDPQIGRFWQIDPLAEKYVYNSTYAFSENKVTSYRELEGLETGSMMYSVPIEKSDEVIKGANDVNTPIAKGIGVGGGLAFSIAFPEIAGPIIAADVFGVPSPSAPTSMIESTTAAVVETNVNLEQRANDIHSTLSPATQSRTTTAVASVTNAEGKATTLVASSERNLRPAQRAALQPGETAVSGPGHAETTILNHAQANGMTVNAVAASRPICPTCAAAINNAGAVPASPLKIVAPPAIDATYVKPPIIKLPNQN